MPAILVPMGVACADAVLARRTDYLRRLPWIAVGLVVGAALYVLPFYLSYHHRGDWQLLELMVRENFVRAFDPFDHVEPPWYYLYILPAMFLPWSLWLPGAIGWALKRIREDAGLRFALLAFLVIFLEFTASKSRRSYYILPAFPACALLVGGFISGAIDALRGDAPLGRPWKILATCPLFLVAVVLPAAGLFFLVAPLLPGAPGELGRAFPLALPLGLALALVALLFFVSWKRSEFRGLFAAAALTALIYTTYASLGGDQIRATTMPERPFAARIASQFPDREIISYRPELRVRLYFPSSTPARGLEELRKILDGRTSEVLVLARPDDAKKLEAAFPSRWREVLRWSAPPFGPIRMDRPKMLLLAYQPQAQESASASGSSGSLGSSGSSGSPGT
jgi:4-amino-4-deoxy-L-arabinose transferase-like glycosyltransferase